MIVLFLGLILIIKFSLYLCPEIADCPGVDAIAQPFLRLVMLDGYVEAE